MPIARHVGLRTPLSKVGFPIRKSADQSFFAAPHGLSQRSTSFIASQRQGIHQMPLRHLIALIINAHPSSVRHWGSRQSPNNKICNGDGQYEFAFALIEH